MTKTLKKRLDMLLVEQGLAPSRAKAQSMIMAGEIMINGEIADKSGTSYPETVEIIVKSQPKFVSRGGEKLQGALQDFGFDATDKIAVDVGASTGGFTDCLLQNGAKKVYAIDVGYGQLAHKIRIDERVVNMERTNARYVEMLPEPIDLVVIDASFISLRIILPPIKRWFNATGDIIALIKPQFEAGKSDVGKGGVVRDTEIHRRVIADMLSFSQELGFSVRGLTRSPLKGPAGNIEFLVWLGWNLAPITLSFEELIANVLPE